MTRVGIGHGWRGRWMALLGIAMIAAVGAAGCGQPPADGGPPITTVGSPAGLATPCTVRGVTEVVRAEAAGRGGLRGALRELRVVPGGSPGEASFRFTGWRDAVGSPGGGRPPGGGGASEQQPVVGTGTVDCAEGVVTAWSDRTGPGTERPDLCPEPPEHVVSHPALVACAGRGG